MSPEDFEWNVPEQFNFTRDVVERLAEDPNRRALTAVDAEGIITRKTFADLALEATRWAHLLRGRGTEPGDRVVVVVGKVPDWLGIMLGALKAGLITVPCTDMLRARRAASSIASGMPSRWQQISAAALALTVVSAKPWRVARTRSTRSRTDSTDARVSMESRSAGSGTESDGT